MKKQLWPYLVAATLLTGSCNQAAENSSPALAGAPAVTVSANAPVTDTASESISYKDIRINGLPFEPTAAALVKTLGRPDRKQPVVECAGWFWTDTNEGGDMYYYGSSTFEVNGPRAVMSTVDFGSGKFRVTVGRQVFDQHTTFEQVRRLYPVAAADVDEWSDPSAGKTYQVIRLEISGSRDSAFYLKFAQGKLALFEHYMPC